VSGVASMSESELLEVLLHSGDIASPEEFYKVRYPREFSSLNCTNVSGMRSLNEQIFMLGNNIDQ
jgi:hypothetical protein